MTRYGVTYSDLRVIGYMDMMVHTNTNVLGVKSIFFIVYAEALVLERLFPSKIIFSCISLILQFKLHEKNILKCQFYPILCSPNATKTQLK